MSSLYATGVTLTTLPVALRLMHHRPRLLLPGVWRSSPRRTPSWRSRPP
ncbi:hypothetical protein NKH77_38825 [Streptomyces sp. M19]